ncbi:hypothetical protein DCAR_0310398 [Daucus carota subsp. sativus]|uniref:Uncharacterized protein n=1 Tax=Daucus carota subsp. sativus TaxID=79200 RepID=A0A165ZUC6_DAUCS|nr:PREDICTED: chaperone protein dnaJ 49-like [Daucus carota subsp. sativus]WOG91150.1 hypothetical protein DCAR_0310398 [Daucus carota subsp. sativus]
MEGNKDEAIRCLKIGRDALDSGDRVRALKFVAKARRLDPSLSVDDILADIEGKSGGDSTNGSSFDPLKDMNKGSLNSGTRRRGASSGTASVAYSEEQDSIVREIKRKKDYYEILGVERSCSVDDVRKAYRKLSLKVHPDKNQAPGAEEAFKLVSKAFQCLSDVESRKTYDVVGSDEPVYERRTARRNQGFNGFYDGDVDAEEIFRNFFFGGMNQGATTHFTGFNFGPGGVNVRFGNNNGSAGGSNMRVLLQLLPVILILLVNFLPSSQPIYILSREYPYEHRVSTQKGVNFYVKSADFEQQYPYGSNERGALELKIEREYASLLTQNCHVEAQRLRWGYIKETPYCDALKRFRNMA